MRCIGRARSACRGVENEKEGTLLSAIEHNREQDALVLGPVYGASANTGSPESYLSHSRSRASRFRVQLNETVEEPRWPRSTPYIAMAASGIRAIVYARSSVVREERSFCVTGLP